MEVLRIENLSKLYDLGQVGTGTVSKDLNRWWAGFRRKGDPYAKIGHVNDRTKKVGKYDSVWALKDINVSVSEGEILGIIGRNGAGKSTLLKIISRITTPTSGVVKVKGRIASLLEVGTGFHPEMTGRENIFMNGTLLGMTRKEIQGRLDEIIDFSGVAMYIDTPVKRYSSGMQVRLAFAVGAFLEPEILIVDEVLAVGDAEFQSKALGKMKSVSQESGRTVLFVSHNMTAIRALCSRAILLANGTLKDDGKPDEIISKYLLNDTQEMEATTDLMAVSNRSGMGAIRFARLTFLDEQGRPIKHPISGSKLIIRLLFHSKEKMEFRNCRVGMAIRNTEGLYVVFSTEMVLEEALSLGNDYSLDFHIPKIPFTKGEYFLTLFLESNSSVEDWLNDALKFSVEDGSYYGTSRSYPAGHEGKIVLIDFNVSKSSINV